MGRTIYRALSLAALLGGLSYSWACSVPVFRYALERWHPDPFELSLFFRGPLTAADSALIARAQQLSSDPMFANLAPFVRVIGDSATDSVSLAKYRALGDTTLPAAALYRMYTPATGAPLVRMALSAEALERIADSPIRREIVRRLTSGETSVWLILTGKDRGKARAVVDTLRRTLPDLEKNLTLPTPDPSSGYFPPSRGVPLKIAFSTLVVSATDPTEQVLVRLLLGSDVQVDTLTEPTVYPMFGRGRALVPIPAAKMTERTVREIATFLTGPCACTVKAQNPGEDLVFAADWSGALQRVETPEDTDTLAELTGLSELAGKAAREGTGGTIKAPKVSTKAAGDSVKAASAPAAAGTTAPACSTDVAKDTSAAQPPAHVVHFQFQKDTTPVARSGMSPVVRSLLWVFVALLVVGVVSTAVVLGRKR